MPSSLNPPVCCCRNGGREWTNDGINYYVSRDPSCRVHSMILSRDTIPASAETIVGNWQNREALGGKV